MIAPSVADAPTTAALDAALVKLQKAVGPIPTPNRGEAGDGDEFEYAKLDVVLRHAGPALAENEIAHTTYMRGSRLYVEIIHAPSGEWRRSWIKLGALVLPWKWAKRFTFVRRYLLVGLLGLAQEGDPDTDDAHGREEAGPRGAAQARGDQGGGESGDGNGNDTGREFEEAVGAATKPIHFTALMPRAKQLGRTKTLRDAAERAGCVLVQATDDQPAHFADDDDSGADDSDNPTDTQWFARLQMARTAEDFTALVPTATTTVRRTALNESADKVGWAWDSAKHQFADRIPF